MLLRKIDLYRIRCRLIRNLNNRICMGFQKLRKLFKRQERLILFFKN